MTPRSLLLALSGVTLSFTPFRSADPPQLLPIYGGSGGTAFTRDCGAGKVVSGLRFRAGLVVDAIGLLCRPVNANGTLGSESTVGTLAGGGGGTFGTRSCPSGTVVVSAGLRYGAYVDVITLGCYSWNAATRTFLTGNTAAAPLGNARSTGTYGWEKCENSAQPASGIRGRSHALVDAIGFVCDEP